MIERHGAVCGLLTTQGFRDVLELRRRDRPDTYGLQGTFEPLVARHNRLEVAERTDYGGNILQPVDEQEVATQARQLLDNGVEAVVVSFLHSYANPSNEQRARQVLEKIWPNPYIVIASEVLPEFREFERTSTAVVNAYVQPLIDRYLRSLAQQLRQKGYERDVLLIQSNGGVMSLDVSRRFSVNTVMSGPAAGVIAARAIAEQAGFANVITCDMGGTSLDIALVAAGQPATTSEINLGYGIPIRVPMLDITTVGAGGGSIAWIDRGGYLQIGPQSAGADPGPACYGRGGSQPTVTDAHLVLGRLNADAPFGSAGAWHLDRSRAAQSITEQCWCAARLAAVRSRPRHHRGGRRQDRWPYPQNLHRARPRPAGLCPGSLWRCRSTARRSLATRAGTEPGDYPLLSGPDVGPGLHHGRCPA